MGSKEDVATRIDADTRVKIEDMNKAVAMHKDPVSRGKKKNKHFSQKPIIK